MGRRGHSFWIPAARMSAGEVANQGAGFHEAVAVQKGGAGGDPPRQDLRGAVGPWES